MVRPLARLLQPSRHRFQTKIVKRTFILGIETSCDDTGVAIISKDGRILGEEIATQTSARYGGVIPSFAMGWHAEALPKITKKALKEASGGQDIPLDRLKDVVEVIAITTRPGMRGSLSIGLQFAQLLSLKNNLPIIPIHHMEAHALTPRMEHKVEFPFMVMLVSGGHCLLAMAEAVDKYKLLGSCHDNAPGQVLDKVARRLKLHTLRSDLRDVSGGKAIQVLGQEGGDPTAFPFTTPLQAARNCNFSFSGLFTHFMLAIDQIEEEIKLPHDQFIPDLPHFCASVEYTMAKHLCERLQRGIEYADSQGMWKSSNQDEQTSRTIVLSGGVASNVRMRSSIEKVCRAFGCQLLVPKPKYCTDNGVMIAWNGLERYRVASAGGNLSVASSILSPEEAINIQVKTREPFGQDISKSVEAANIKCKFVDIG